MVNYQVTDYVENNELIAFGLSTHEMEEWLPSWTPKAKHDLDILASWFPNRNMRKSLLDQPQNLTGIGPIMLQEPNSDVFWVLLLLESFQLRTSISDVGCHTFGSCSSYQKVLEEDSDTKDH